MLDQQKITILYCRLSNEDAQEGRALAADVHQAEVFTAALRRDDLAEIRPAQG